MYLVFLCEDKSGECFLKHTVPMIINSSEHECYFHSYSGIGRIPSKMKSAIEIKTSMLLNDLPKMLRAYGKIFANYPEDFYPAVFVVCDLDNKNEQDFKTQLKKILASCSPQPITFFCIAIEEGEAWLLGDIDAIKNAYPNAKVNILTRYTNDSICGTWELLADAVYRGGHTALSQKPYFEIGAAKIEWATKVCPHMDVNANKSKSFQLFRDTLRTYTRTVA